MPDLVSHLAALGSWAYAAVFLAAALESSAFLGLLVPGETFVVFAGFMAARGILALEPLVAAVSAGAILGDTIGYQLGARLGGPWLLRYGRFVGIGPAELRRTDDFFARYGGAAVVIGRFVGLLRALTPFVAGASRMRYPRFLLYNALGGVAWSVAYVLLGRFLGAGSALVERWIGGAGAAAALIVVLLFFVLRRLRSTTARRGGRRRTAVD